MEKAVLNILLYNVLLAGAGRWYHKWGGWWMEKLRERTDSGVVVIQELTKISNFTLRNTEVIDKLIKSI